MTDHNFQIREVVGRVIETLPTDAPFEAAVVRGSNQHQQETEFLFRRAAVGPKRTKSRPAPGTSQPGYSLTRRKAG